jgi:protein phosphatase
VTRALGIEESVEVDLDELPLMRGDRLLLCSDGLTRGVKSGDIMKVLRGEGDPQSACDELVRLANGAGGEDNTTVVLVALRTSPGGRIWTTIRRRWAAMWSS